MRAPHMHDILVQMSADIKSKSSPGEGSGTTRAPVKQLSDRERSAAEYASEVARACLQVVMNLTYQFQEAQVT
jgi:hypothetical protein